MALEPINRPDNVIVPRNVQRRIEARRALQEGTVEDMKAVLREHGHKVPSGATKDDLTAALYEMARDGNVTGTLAGAGQTAATTDGGK